MRQNWWRIVLLAVLCLVLPTTSSWAVPPARAFINTGAALGVAHYIMGYNAELLGNLDQAKDDYQKSIRFDGSSGVVHLRLAMVLAQLGSVDDAIAAAQSAVRINPADLEAHYFLALVYAQLRREAEAKAEYEIIFKALAEKNPRKSEFAVYLGQLYYASGKKQQAMEQFALAVEMDPKNTDLLYVVGSYYLDTDKRSEGIKLIKQCLVVNPEDPDCLNSLAYAYAEDNINIDEAMKAIYTALKAEPNNAAFIDTLGWLHYRKGDLENALKELNRADSLLKDPTILGHLAEVYAAIGRKDEAARYQREKEQISDAKRKKDR